MKKLFNKVLRLVVKPLYGSGVGNYFPFNYGYSLFRYIYEKTSFSGIRRVRTKEGFYLYLNPQGQYLERELIIKGSYEQTLISLVKQDVSSEGIVIDVGANIGYHTLVFSKLVGTKGTVHAFEPVKENISLLRKNISLNDVNNVIVHEKGVSSMNTSKLIYLSEDNFGAHSLEKTSEQTEEIDLVVLDEIFDELIQLIKIDVEGHELEVFSGMERLILEKKIQNIAFEFNPKEYGKKTSERKKNARNLLNNLSKQYNLYEIKRKKSKKIQDIDSFIDEHMSSQCNIYARRKNQA